VLIHAVKRRVVTVGMWDVTNIINPIVYTTINVAKYFDFLL